VWIEGTHPVTSTKRISQPEIYDYENMVVKTRKQNVKDQPPQPNVDDRDRSPFVSPGTGKSRRAGKGTPFNSLLHNKNGLFPGFSFIRSKLGLTPSAFVKLGITLVLGKCHTTHIRYLASYQYCNYVANVSS
jgi:hypothetical protein